VANELVTVKYVGRHPAVEIDPDGFGRVTVVRGETLNVEPDVGANMLLQEANWALVNDAKPAAKEKVTN
jgi:hypothetical protein